MMQRRHLLLGTVAAAGAIPCVHADGWTDGLAFRVSREGSPIGWHRVLLDRQGERLTTSISIELDVRIAFIRVYSYRHRNREIWDGDRFIEFASETDDNGDRHKVRAVAGDGGIVVEGSSGRQLVSNDHAPTTWWARRLTEPGMWIDTQTGRTMRSKVTLVGRERIVADGTATEADRLRLDGDVKLDAWYAGERWVGLEFRAEADGSLITYSLVATGPAAATASS